MAKVRKQEQRLIRIGKAEKNLLDNWSEGAQIVADSGLSIEQLKQKVVAERWRLALEHRREGKRLWQLASPPYRAIVSRYYYVMYHAMRAAVYLNHGGDDFEQHTKLPTKIPHDFPDRALWKNSLKNARLNRNAADYDPYPKSRTVWKVEAKNTRMDADKLIALVRSYLRKKGCSRI